MNKHELKFINDVNSKYGDGVYLFDKMVYVNQHTDIELFCTNHNGYFSISPMHMVRKTCKGCNVCQRNTCYSNEEFIAKCKKIHGDTFSYNKTNYVGQHKKIIVYCNTHCDYYEINPATLLKGKTGCGICSGKAGRTSEQFVVEATKIHNNKYQYDLVEYQGSNTPIKIICKEHGEFSQTPKAHLTGRGCPGCGEYGYQPHKPGTFYIQKLSNEEKTVYKFGISGDVVRRMREQSRKSRFNHELLHEIQFDDGNDALLLEKKIKSTIPYGVVTKEELYSGFSETFDEEYLEEVLKMIKDA